jgi:hypothetical protein
MQRLGLLGVANPGGKAARTSRNPFTLNKSITSNRRIGFLASHVFSFAMGAPEPTAQALRVVMQRCSPGDLRECAWSAFSDGPGELGAMAR